MLSDNDISAAIVAGDITIDPLTDQSQIQPASVDLTLDSRFLVPHNPEMTRFVLDPREDNSEAFYQRGVETGKPFLLYPHHFVLGATRERVGLCPAIGARVEGKSSLARLGLVVHVTGGFIDPGFEGPITLEMFNAMSYPIRLWPGMKVCQVAFTRLSSPAKRPYGHPDLKSKYTDNADGPTVSRMHENWKDDK